MTPLTVAVGVASTLAFIYLCRLFVAESLRSEVAGPAGWFR